MKTVRLLLITLLVASCGHGLPYSDGERAGYVLKFSNKGLFCKTWEGSMNLAGTGQNSLVEWHFTVDSDKAEAIKLLQEAVITGRRVRVVYRDTVLSGFCTTEFISGYFIQSAEYADGKD